MCLLILSYYLLDVAILLHRRLILVGPFVLLLFIDRVGFCSPWQSSFIQVRSSLSTQACFHLAWLLRQHFFLNRHWVGPLGSDICHLALHPTQLTTVLSGDRFFGCAPLVQDQYIPSSWKAYAATNPKKETQLLQEGVKKGQGFLDLVRALPCQKLELFLVSCGERSVSLCLWGWGPARDCIEVWFWGVSFSPLVVLKPVSYGSVPVGRRAACLVKVAVASVAVVWAGLAAFGQLAKSSYSQPIWIWRCKRQHCRLFQKRRVSEWVESKSKREIYTTTTLGEFQSRMNRRSLQTRKSGHLVIQRIAFYTRPSET